MPSEPTMTPLTRIISDTTVYPTTKSTLPNLKLSTSDLSMLSKQYIQKGNLFLQPPILFPDLVHRLKQSLSTTLTQFPPLAGRLVTDADGYVYIACNDLGAKFVHADATSVRVNDVVTPLQFPDVTETFFALNRMVCYEGHSNPILAVQVTELCDGVFIGFTVNHGVVDGTSLWHFINTFAEICNGVNLKQKQPCFARDSVFISPAVLKVPVGGPKVTFDEHAPMCERVFKFSRESILKLKHTINGNKSSCDGNGEVNINAVETKPEPEISSFQSLCALLWRAVTRARKLENSKMTTFRLAVNCRHKLEPKLDPFYFGNAIQSIATYATAGDVLSHDLKWCAEQLNKNISGHDDKMIRRFVKNWEMDPKCFPLGNPEGTMIIMGSSPRFPMFDNDFGWGKPVAVRSGRTNKFDGKISAFPGRDGDGSVDLEVGISPETMAELEVDVEFMQYVSGC